MTGPRFRFILFVLVAVLVSSVVFASAQTRRGAVKGGAKGKGWSTADINGVRWLIDPQGKPFYSKGVDIVAPGAESQKSMAGHAFFWPNFCSSMNIWRADVGARLRKWGFNTLGGWSDRSPGIGLPLMVDLELGRSSQFHWFDPFDPQMGKITMQRARELTAPYRNLPQLIGYFSDNEERVVEFGAFHLVSEGPVGKPHQAIFVANDLQHLWRQLAGSSRRLVAGGRSQKLPRSLRRPGRA